MQQQGTIGADVPRKDGVAKVTGAARYAADVDEPGLAHAILVTSTIAKGKITRVDDAAARAVPGVLAVLTHENAPPYKELKSMYAGGPGQASFWPLRSPEIRYAGQIVGVVAAETLPAAREAARALRIEYEPDGAAAVVALGSAEDAREHAKPVRLGRASKALAAAEVSIEATYTTPVQHHNPIEMFSATAAWRGDDELTLHVPSQGVRLIQNGVAQQLGLDPAKVRVVCPYVGGAFGSKGTLSAYPVLAALAAKGLGRPVKLHIGRDQMFTIASFRAETRQEVALGSDAGGHLKAYRHVSDHGSSRFDDVVNAGTEMAARMYLFGAIEGVERVVARDTNSPGFMRAPNEVPAFFALESAMDELAWKLGVDPVELRLRNDTLVDPVKGVPFSSRSLAQCFRRGSELFGWQRRGPDAAPGTSRSPDGWLIGHGCATATYPTHIVPSAARVRLGANGAAHVEVGAAEIGTGTYTIAAQVAAAELDVPVEAVSVELGDTRLPAGPLAGGSVTAAAVSSAVQAACQALRKKLVDAGADPATPPAEAVRRAEGGAVEAEASWSHPESPSGALAKVEKGSLPIIGPVTKTHAMCAFGAEFVEVRVNPRTGEVRVPRMVGVFAAGTILNPRTAKSQLLGGMIWGLSSALHEATEVDEKRGHFVNANIAEYLIPVCADVGEVVVETLPEEDRFVNPLGVKGIGEIGIVGTAAAIANAVHHATGVRIRELPIRMEKVLAGLGRLPG